MTHFAVEDRNQVLMGPVISIALTPYTLIPFATIRYVSGATQCRHRHSLVSPTETELQRHVVVDAHQWSGAEKYAF